MGSHLEDLERRVSRLEAAMDEMKKGLDFYSADKAWTKREKEHEGRARKT